MTVPASAPGCSPSRSAAAPAPWPTAIDVPDCAAYASSPGESHRRTPPHALTTSTPGAHASTHAPVAPWTYARSAASLAPIVSADVTLAGETSHASASRKFPAATTTSAPVRLVNWTTARSMASDL